MMMSPMLDQRHHSGAYGQQDMVVLVPTAHGYVPAVYSPGGGVHAGAGYYYDSDDEELYEQSGPAASTNDKYEGGDGGHYGGREAEEVDDGGPKYPGIQEDNAHVPVQRKERGKSVFGLKK